MFLNHESSGNAFTELDNNFEKAVMVLIAITWLYLVVIGELKQLFVSGFDYFKDFYNWFDLV